MAFGNGPRIVTNGLILSLDASDRNSYPGSGTTWFDLTGNNNSGSLVNGPTFSTSNKSAIVLDGANDYINLGTSTILTSTDFSYSFWVNNPSASVNGIIFGADSCGDNGGHYSFIGPAGNAGFRVVGSTSLTIGSSQIVNDSTWHNIACTKSSTTMALYIDGILSVTGSTPTGIGSTLYTRYIGLRGGTLSNPAGCGSTYYSGSIASLLVYNKMLLPTEILQNYNAQKSRFGL